MNQKADIKTRNLLNNFICTITFICSLMVVGIHQYNAGTLDKFSITALLEGFLAHGIFIAAVPCFFILSGFLFFRNTDKITDVYKKQTKRIKSVLIPFLAWSTFYCLLNYIKRLLGGSISFSLLYFIKEILFYIHCFPLWYMFQLIVYIILSPVIFIILKRRNLSFILLILFCVMGLFYNPSTSISVCETERALFQFNFFAYYFIGCVSAKYLNLKKISNIVDKTPLTAICVLLILFGIIESLLYDEIILSFNKRCFVPLVAGLLLFLVLKLCLKGKCLSKLPFGVSTMMIYGIHPFVGIILARLLAMLPVHPLLLFFTQCILVTVFSYISAMIIKKIPPLYRILSGNR